MEYLSKIMIVVFLFVAFDMIPSQNNNSIKSFDNVDTMIIKSHKNLAKTEQVCKNADIKKDQMINDVTKNIIGLKSEVNETKYKIRSLKVTPKKDIILIDSLSK